jgi:D-alanyl-lipoteichoic acid acyltransferase DltB (MBOAT superfamily)
MLFHSQVFLLIFFPVILAGYYLFAGNRPFRIWFLIIASFIFYGYWDFRLIPLLAGSIAINWALAGAHRRWPRMPLILLGIFANLLVLGIFKYANFAAEMFAWLSHLEQQRWSIVLPLGISFFTFQQISYLADTARDRAPAYRFHEYALYVCFFPQLIAGPIVRHNELIFQFERDPRQGDLHENLSRGAILLLLGLIKKVFIADRLAVVADPLFAAAAAGSMLGLVDAWTAPLAFGLQIYFDFSGYSDMAIGLALMLGLHLPVNFNAPYRALSIREFWRRWHLTLSRFLRDYVYIPTGGNRAGPARQVLAIMITMLLGGLWHGAGWTFVVWGGLHGCALVVNHLWTRIGGKLTPLLAWSATMAFVFTTWVFFRAETFSGAATLLWSMVGGGIGATQAGTVGLLEVGVLTTVAAMIALAGPTSQEFARERLEPRPAIATLGGLAAVAILLQVGGGANAEFIYFQF